MKKLNHHLKYGIIAGSLAVLTLFVSLSAFLTTSTEKNPYNPSYSVIDSPFKFARRM